MTQTVQQKSLLGDDVSSPETQRSNEWYTPSRYIEAARSVMGRIDLDPASCEKANQTVKAARYYDEAMNGLIHPWFGRVWLNPPYGLLGDQKYGKRFHAGGPSPEKKSLQTMFIARAINEYEINNVEQVVLLVTANITVKWFQPLWRYPLCVPHTKISFYVPGLSESQRQVFGNVFVYLGPNEDRFTEVFSKFGRIVRAVDTPRPKPIARELWESEVTA